LENPHLENELDRLGDELNVARATLEAELAELRLSLQVEGDRRHKALAELYELAGTLLKEEATLADLELQRRRTEALRGKKAIPEAQYDSARLAESGQRAKIDKLCQAIAQLEERAAAAGTEPDLGYGELKPTLARIESLQNQIVRTRAQLARCEVKSPVSGLVVKRYFLPGEHAGDSETIFEVLADESLEAVVYFPAEKAASVEIGQRIPLSIPGSPEIDSGLVTRLGNRLEPVPPVVARHYAKNETTLPVHLRPESRLDRPVRLQLGRVVRVPFFRSRLASWRDAGA
jgi:multidrug resistance efflux pump